MPNKKIVLSRETELLAVLHNSFFRRDGFAMVPVQDGQSGFKAVETEAPALAVFDIAELGVQVIDCCRSIKQDPLLAATPVLLILPEGDEEELADQCWDAGCDAVIHRPLAADRFLDAACRLLGISRRLDRRLPVSFQLEFVDSNFDRRYGNCVNLNVGGMYLETEDLYPVNSTLTLEFCLPGLRGSLQQSVRVAWVNHPEWVKKNAMPCGMGLQFINKTNEFGNLLRRYLYSLSTEED